LSTLPIPLSCLGAGAAAEADFYESSGHRAGVPMATASVELI